MAGHYFRSGQITFIRNFFPVLIPILHKLPTPLPPHCLHNLLIIDSLPDITQLTWATQVRYRFFFLWSTHLFGSSSSLFSFYYFIFYLWFSFFFLFSVLVFRNWEIILVVVVGFFYSTKYIAAVMVNHCFSFPHRCLALALYTFIIYFHSSDQQSMPFVYHIACHYNIN